LLGRHATASRRAASSTFCTTIVCSASRPVEVAEQPFLCAYGPSTEASVHVTIRHVEVAAEAAFQPE
jgi:hypothetical protein